MRQVNHWHAVGAQLGPVDVTSDSTVPAWQRGDHSSVCTDLDIASLDHALLAFPTSGLVAHPMTCKGMFWLKAPLVDGQHICVDP